MIHPETLGCHIAERRRRLGLTQCQVADRLGITPQAVSKWERGVSCPDVVYLDELATVLDVGIEELLRGTCPTEPQSDCAQRERELKKTTLC